MIQEICKDERFLAQKAEPATPADLPVAQDLIDTLTAHKDGCVGMAANMIGVNKRIIIFDNEGAYHSHVQPRHREAVRAISDGGGLSVPHRAAAHQAVEEHQGPVAE